MPVVRTHPGDPARFRIRHGGKGHLNSPVVQSVERPTLNQEVDGSNPSRRSRTKDPDGTSLPERRSDRHGKVAEWSIAAGCNPAPSKARWFESIPSHQNDEDLAAPRGGSRSDFGNSAPICGALARFATRIQEGAGTPFLLSRGEGSKQAGLVSMGEGEPFPGRDGGRRKHRGFTALLRALSSALPKNSPVAFACKNDGTHIRFPAPDGPARASGPNRTAPVRNGNVQHDGAGTNRPENPTTTTPTGALASSPDRAATRNGRAGHGADARRRSKAAGIVGPVDRDARDCGAVRPGPDLRCQARRCPRRPSKGSGRAGARRGGGARDGKRQ